MAKPDPRLVPCLTRLRGEFDQAYPKRLRDSDGWIGDPAHQATDSDHNPDARGLVHALDVDKDLLGKGTPTTFLQSEVDAILDRCRSGA